MHEPKGESVRSFKFQTELYHEPIRKRHYLKEVDKAVSQIQ